MIEHELKQLIEKLQNRNCEDQIVKVKVVNRGYHEGTEKSA